MSFPFTFEATDGQEQPWQVPAGVNRIRIEVWGAGRSTAPVNGGYSSGYFDVTSGSILQICPGTRQSGTTGGVAGGLANGGNGTSLGGCAGSYVRVDSGFSTIASAWIVAGGAGLSGGSGGGNMGTNGGANAVDGKGANMSTPGAGGVGNIQSGSPGVLGKGGNGTFGGGGGWGGGGGSASSLGGIDGSGGGGSGGFPNKSNLFISKTFITAGQNDSGFEPNPSSDRNGYIRITDDSGFPFNFLASTGQEQTWSVPVGVNRVRIEAWGAGFNVTSLIVNGAYASAYYDVTPGQNLQICPGTKGSGASGGIAGGLSNGGTATVGFGGSAGSYVRDSTSALSISSTWIVSAGAGGSIGAGPGGFGGGGSGTDGGTNAWDGKGGNNATPGIGGTGNQGIGGNGNQGIGGNGGPSGGFGGGGGWAGGGGGALETVNTFGNGAGGTSGFPNQTNLVLTEPVIRAPQTSFLFVPNPSFNLSGYVRISDESVLCVAEDSLVNVLTCIGEEINVRIQDLEVGMLLLNKEGNRIQVRNLVEFKYPAREMIMIEKHNISPEAPTEALYIMPGHPIWINDREILPELLEQQGMARRVYLENRKKVYSIMTERRDFCQVQGLYVGTWSEDAFLNLQTNSHVGHCRLLSE